MRYFSNAKDRMNESLSLINPDYRPTMIRKMLPRNAWDTQDREIDQVRHSDLREQINYLRRKNFARVLENQEYDSILRFAPESRRCCCAHWMLNHTETVMADDRSRWLHNVCDLCLDFYVHEFHSH